MFFCLLYLESFLVSFQDGIGALHLGCVLARPRRVHQFAGGWISALVTSLGSSVDTKGFLILDIIGYG